jgi:hypothetical protein
MTIDVSTIIIIVMVLGILFAAFLSENERYK